MAPVPERNLIHGWSAPSDAARNAPISNWATVPTTISESAVAMRNQMESRVATRASPSQSAAIPQTSYIACSFPGIKKTPAP